MTMPSSRQTPIPPSFTQGIAGKQSAACLDAEAGEVAEWWCALGAGVEGGFRCKVEPQPIGFSRRIKSHRPRANQQNIRDE